MRILIVEDDRLLRLTLKAHLEQQNPTQAVPYTIHLAESYEESTKLIEKEAIDIAFIDINLGDNQKDGGIKLLKHFRKNSTETVTIIMTGSNESKLIEECLQLGAADFILKPFEPSNVYHLMTKAIVQHRLFRRNESLRVQAGDRTVEPVELKSKSPKFKEIIENAKRLKGKRLRILITGESGTGKEVMARFIWSQEGDISRPFIPVHCGAIPENLVESNLFGHTKGSFTGATTDKKGYFEAADGGDIFLDEIGTMPSDVQIKVLRTLNSGEVVRVGATAGKRFNFRVIAATNENIEQLTKEDKFREDLLYRLNEVTIHLPPLRERKEDIPDLIENFLHKNGHFEKYFSKDAIETCLNYNWPGNIRQLEKTVGVLAELAENSEISDRDVRQHLRLDEPQSTNGHTHTNGKPLIEISSEEIKGRFQNIVEDTEKNMIRHALRNFKNPTRAARYLGIPRNSLIRRMNEWGMNEEIATTSK